VVAGATRGAGRGIAAALGESGATVICTGRSTRAAGSSRSDYDRRETIEETAELVTRLGGTGIARAVTDTAGELAKEYGFTDVDGSRPDVWRYNEDVDQGLAVDPNAYR
jgi:NAD(P)-dependent dehydrogenase (short-subunit alcohol dehydrogenase family)